MIVDYSDILTSNLKSISMPSIVDLVIDIHPDNKDEIHLLCGSEYEERIKVEFSSGDLKVNTKGNFYSTGAITLHVKTSTLQKLNLSGSGDIKGKFSGDNLNIKSSGTGDISLSGTVKNLDCTISGTGDVLAPNLKAQNLNIISSGTGDAKMFASDICIIKSSGTGDIHVDGKPGHLEKKSSGVGDITVPGAKLVSKSKQNSLISPNDFVDMLNIDIFTGMTNKKTSITAMEENAKAMIDNMNKKMQMDMQKMKNSFNQFKEKSIGFYEDSEEHDHSFETKETKEINKKIFKNEIEKSNEKEVKKPKELSKEEILKNKIRKML